MDGNDTSINALLTIFNNECITLPPLLLKDLPVFPLASKFLLLFQQVNNSIRLNILIIVNVLFTTSQIMTTYELYIIICIYSEVDGKVYRAYVKEKEEAQQIYDNAVQQGQTAAQVALT